MGGHSHAAEYDSHGHAPGHGHVIVPIFTLRFVLVALLFFTLLTVGLSKGEAWLAATFNFDIPQWVNVVVAMSIAVVKTTLVVLYFMQLKYDSPLNGMIFIFTILTVTFFLGFTMIDLGGRGTIDRFKAHYVMPGGTGLNADGPIVERAKTIAALEGHAEHAELHVPPSRGLFTNAGYRAPTPASGSSADVARPVSGLTLPGFVPQTATGHADEHGHEGAPAAPEAAPAEHAAPAGH